MQSSVYRLPYLPQELENDDLLNLTGRLDSSCSLDTKH